MRTNEKNWINLLAVLTLCLMLTGSCKKNEDEIVQEIPPKKVGILKFKTVNPFTSIQKSFGFFKVNPPLTGDTTVTLNTSIKACIGDIWVSQGEVKAGNPDNLEWVKITSVTNHDLKLFEDYVFDPKELTAGTYKSIKISLKNIFYRYNVLQSDTSIIYELLETMGSSLDPCNENDTSWIKPNYFSTDGNNKLNDNGVFELVAPGEKVGGFTVEPGKAAVVKWRLGAGVTVPCINYLIDLNGNREWNCGVDNIHFECPPEMEYMFDFVVEYE